MKLIQNSELLLLKERGEILLRNQAAKGQPVRLAVLSTFNLASLPPFMAAALDQYGLSARIYVSPFGQLMQEALNRESSLYKSEPQFLVLALAYEDLLQPVFETPLGFTPETLRRFCEGRGKEIESALNRIAERLPNATMIVVPIGCVRPPNPHLLSSQSVERGNRALQNLTAALSEACGQLPRTLMADWDSLEAYLGRSSCREGRFWYAARMRFSFQGLAQFAGFVAGHVAAVALPPRKVLVLDLDNTLWGGVLGEDGLEQLELGEEGTGLAFRELQRQILTLHGMGVLLALCSKNDEADALRAIEQHPGMLLRRNHFSAIFINWNDKAENLRSISTELSLGLDTFVFVDDNPVERDRIRQALPEVAVLELPADPADRPGVLADCGLFSRAELTYEDKRRNSSYASAKQRKQFRASLQSVEEFLASLQQDILVSQVSDPTLPRASQLCLRTNQFNLTTKRYTQADLRTLVNSSVWEILTIAVRDRFEDSGIVGLAMLRFQPSSAEIDSLMLSCRVLGRGIEAAVLRVLAKRAQARGARKMVGLYSPTAKNALVKDFYPNHGFRELSPGTFEIEVSAPVFLQGVVPEFSEWTRI